MTEAQHRLQQRERLVAWLREKYPQLNAAWNQFSAQDAHDTAEEASLWLTR